MDTGFGYTFPAIKGLQAGQEYYVSMCPLVLIPKLFLFDEDEINPEFRAQRVLNKSRIPEITNYILSNELSYTFSAITASIDGKVKFIKSTGVDNLGTLHVPMEAKLIINDGQHRRAAIEMALKENPKLETETIAVVFYVDMGMKRAQQMFTDLNQYAVRTSKSLSVLYDHRDPMSQITRDTVSRLNFFLNLVEREKTSLSNRSRKLFTLSAIHGANIELLSGLPEESSVDKSIILLKKFWTEVYNNLDEWQQVSNGIIPASEVRQTYLHSHGTILNALGHLGNYLFKEMRTHWQKVLRGLKGIDWSRSNLELWDERAMHHGKVSKSRNNIILTANIIKKQLKLALTEDEQAMEDKFTRKGSND